MLAVAACGPRARRLLARGFTHSLHLHLHLRPCRPYGRAPNAKMGINQRDDVAAIGESVMRLLCLLCRALCRLPVSTRPPRPPQLPAPAQHRKPCRPRRSRAWCATWSALSACGGLHLTRAVVPVELPVPAGSMVVRGRNSLFLSAADGGTWVLTLQLARRRTMDQVRRGGAGGPSGLGRAERGGAGQG